MYGADAAARRPRGPHDQTASAAPGADLQPVERAQPIVDERAALADPAARWLVARSSSPAAPSSAICISPRASTVTSEDAARTRTSRWRRRRPGVAGAHELRDRLCGARRRADLGVARDADEAQCAVRAEHGVREHEPGHDRARVERGSAVLGDEAVGRVVR